MVGVGVIGSVYAGKLAHVGHEVDLFARGRRLTELQNDGLVLQEARSDELTVLRLPIRSEISNERYDLILVPVRSEQLVSTLPILTAITAGDSDVLFFGNTAGRQAELAAVLGDRVLFGFPAVGGVRDGSVIKYVLINRQKTTLGESNGETTPRIQRLQSVFDDAGFSTKISANIDCWLLAHAAFIVPIALSLYRFGISAAEIVGRFRRNAADGAHDKTRVRRIALRWQHRGSGQSPCPLQPANGICRCLLAKGLRQPERRALVRCARARRSRRDAFPSQTTPSLLACPQTFLARSGRIAGYKLLTRIRRVSKRSSNVVSRGHTSRVKR